MECLTLQPQGDVITKDFTGNWALDSCSFKGRVPHPFLSPSQKPSLFSVCISQTAADMSSALCLSPWFPAKLPIICKCHSASTSLHCHLTLVLQLCPQCDSLVTLCKARTAQWATGNVLVLAGHAGTVTGYTIWGPGAQSCGLFWKKQVILSNDSFFLKQSWSTLQDSLTVFLHLLSHKRSS